MYKFLGVGVGLFLLALVWALAIFLSYLSFKAKKLRPLGVIGLVLATFTSILLLNIPQRTSIIDVLPQFYFVDGLFLFRVALLIILGLSVVGGFSLVFITHWMEPIFAKPLKNITPRCLS